MTDTPPAPPTDPQAERDRLRGNSVLVPGPELAKLRQERDDLAGQVTRLTEALRAVEWGWHHARCPCCHRWKGTLGHHPDCVLAAALGDAPPWTNDGVGPPPAPPDSEDSGIQ